MQLITKAVRNAYSQHKSNAARRGIAFEMTLSEWWEIWQPYYHLRGRGKNNLVMARKNDEGPYSKENVYLTTNLGNILDFHKSDKAKTVFEELRKNRYAARKHPLWTKARGASAKVSLISSTEGIDIFMS